MALARIRLIVTGDLERAALVPSLRPHFPAQTLHGVDVEWLPPRKVQGATTHRLRADAAPSTTMRTLARAVVAEALRGADGRAVDLVLAVDDLELHNIGQPQVVCAHFREAVRLELAERTQGLLVGEQGDARAAVRERCSFHLLSPMVESVLFGEHAALVRAGCAPTVAPQLASTDWEQLWCTDPAHLPRCAAENARKAGPPQPMPWWQEERHAKHYLEHLIAQGSGALYEETQQGARALQQLAWPQVPKQVGECPLIRALFEDLAGFFGVPSPLGPGAASPHTYAGPPHPQRPRLLRNL